MKTFLLLLTLITGSEAETREIEVKACVGGWVDFICRYPKVNQTYQTVTVKFKGRSLTTKLEKQWKRGEGLSVFHNTTSKNLRVIIRGLGPNDFGDCKCKFFANSGEEKVKVKVEEEEDTNVCLSPSTQAVYTGAQTNITCEFTEYPYKTWAKFLCRDNGVICEDILTTESSLPSNGTFRLIQTSTGFIISISNVSKQHEGVYWCGLKPADGSYRAGFKRLQLDVKAASWLSIIIPVVISVVVLLIIFILVYKRFKCLRNRREWQMETDNEERTYEEIQEFPLQTNSGTVFNTIYTTAQHPTVPSAPALHSNNTGTNTKEVNDQTYSTAWYTRHSPTYSTVNPPTTLPEEPFYSTISNHSSPEEGPH